MIFDIPFRVNDGHAGTATYDNADVEMHTLSTNKLAQYDNAVTYWEHEGQILHMPTGRISMFFAMYGVCLIWRHVDSKVLADPEFHEEIVRRGNERMPITDVTLQDQHLFVVHVYPPLFL